MIQLIGEKQLLARLDAVKPGIDLMRQFVVLAVAEQKRLVPRKTGNLGRSIRIGSVTPSYAETIAGASYAAFVELGTRPHDILPRTRKVLAFPAPGSATLSGRTRKGGQVRFARRVRHPGTKPKPFMKPGAIHALDLLGVTVVERAWDAAG